MPCQYGARPARCRVQTMNALIVGAGTSGFLHALSLRAAGIAITGVFDPDRARARDLAAVTGAKIYEDLTRFDGNVVAICSPPNHHVAQAVALARPGRLTFLEKPVACDRAGLTTLAALPGVVPILQWRAGQAAHALRAAFRSNAFGARPNLTCELRLWRDDAYLARTASWDCHALLSIGVHAIDLVLASVGRPVVGARGRSAQTHGDLEIVFDDGTTAQIRIDLEQRGHDDVCVVVTGKDVSATLRAPEADPTAHALSFRGIAAPQHAGATGSPLLVPFLDEALAAFVAGRPTLGIADVALAHGLALDR